MKNKRRSENFVKKLSKRQENVLNDMFFGEKTLQEILKVRRVSLKTYLSWQVEPAYIESFDRWILSSKLMLAATLAAYSQHAIATLVQLTGNEKTETARKACLDIIALVEKDKKDEPNIPKKLGNRLLVSSTTHAVANNVPSESLTENSDMSPKKSAAILSALADLED